MDSTVLDGAYVATELAAHLAQEFKNRNWSLRDAEAHIGISKTALINILRKGGIPTLETIGKISDALDIPFWRIVEMCGFNLKLPSSTSDQAKRLAALFESAPEYRPVLEMLLALRPDDLEGMLTYLEAMEARRGRRDRQE